MEKRDVIHAMELSGLAYQAIQPNLPGDKLTIIDDAESGVQCYIRKREDVLNITFRGSNSLTDWKHNLTFWKKCIPYDNTCYKIRVHTGFLTAYKAPHVRGKLHELMTKDVRLVRISGHSLGAALSVLCAVDLQYNFPDRDYEVIVFGCPRVGNRAFQKSFNSRIFKTLRVENGNDIVTKVPFASWGYRHVGIKIHVGVPRIFGLVSAEEHRPQNYFKNIFKGLPS